MVTEAKAMLEDIAILTGGTVISEEVGLKLKIQLSSSMAVLNLLRFRKRTLLSLTVQVTRMLYSRKNRPDKSTDGRDNI